MLLRFTNVREVQTFPKLYNYLIRSRKMLQNEYLLAKIGLDTAENEPLQVWGVIQFNIQSTPYS